MGARLPICRISSSKVVAGNCGLSSKLVFQYNMLGFLSLRRKLEGQGRSQSFREGGADVCTEKVSIRKMCDFLVKVVSRSTYIYILASYPGSN